jgi:Sperm-tail PG-rich repeat
MYSTAKHFKVPEYYQFFGSICERFNAPTSVGDNVGPGSYFKETTNVKNKKRPKSKAPFNSRSERNFLNKTDKVPGPGIYNPEKIRKKQNDSLKMIFASSTKRDTNIIQCIKDNPGPGAYFEVNNELKTNENKPNYKHTAPFKATERVSAFDIKDENPTVGMYNPDIVNNIHYINSKKAFKPSIVNVPFSSLKKRFEDKKADTLIGPGQYFKEIEFQNKLKQSNIPFRTAEIRFKSQQKREFFVPVGTYNVTSHFDWNKKTFNINFL